MGSSKKAARGREGRFFIHALVVIAIFVVSSILVAPGASAFSGPSQSGGSGSGGIGVDAANNVSVGTSSPVSDTKFTTVGSSTDSSWYAMKVLKSNATPIIYARNDGYVSIGGAITSTGMLYVYGNIASNGTILGNYTGNINAANVTTGVYPMGGDYAYRGRLGVGTSSVSVPYTLSVYGDAAWTGTLQNGTVPWARLSGHPSISPGTGLTGGGVLDVTRTLTLNTAGISSCTNASTSKVIWDSGNARLTCSTDGGGSGAITSLNGQTGLAQTFATSSSGSGFTLTSSGNTHTLYIGTASAANTGLLATGDWTTFNNKIGSITGGTACGANRVMNISAAGAVTCGTAAVVETSRAINTNAGSGLTGGGNLSADRNLSVSLGSGATQTCGGSTDKVRSISPTGTIVCQADGGGAGTVATTTSASANYVAKFNAAGGAAIQDSIIRDNGTGVGIGAAVSATNTLYVNGNFTANGTIIGNYTGNINAANVTTGVYPMGGDYAYRGRLGVGTSSVSVPYTLSVYGDAAWTGTLQNGTVPWARLSGHPSISPGTGLTGGGVLDVTRTLTLNLNSGVAQTCSGNNRVSAISATGIVTCTAETATGTVTSVSGGTGLSGGPITGSGTLTLNTAGISSCTNASTSKVIWDSGNARLTCSTDGGGSGAGTVMSVTAGSGLSGGTITSTGTIALNITGGTACGANRVMNISAAGAVTCGTAAVVETSRAINTNAGSGLTGGGNLSADRNLSVSLGSGATQTCGGSTDKVRSISPTGTIVCQADGGGAGTVATTTAASASYFPIFNAAGGAAIRDSMMMQNSQTQLQIGSIGSGGTNLRIRNYPAVGGTYSGESLVLGDNVMASESTVDGMVVINNHASYAGAAITVNGANGIAFHTKSGSATAGAAFSSQRMVIDGSGNVGVSTTAPSYKLDVTGQVNANSLSGSGGYISSGNYGGTGNAAYFPSGIWANGANSWIYGAVTFSGAVSGISSLSTTGNITVNSGNGKITVATVDPLYTINGRRYATFMAAMTGVKEETTGNVNLLCGNGECKYVIDFGKQVAGSDLWLFAKTTNLKQTMGQMTVLLTPGFNGTAWYDTDASAQRLTIYGSKSGKVSYRLTGPRFDTAKWPNIVPDDSEPGVAGLIIND